MSNTKLITQDYQNALEIWSGYRNDDTELSFIRYLEKIIVELEKPEPEPEKFTWKEMVEILSHTTCYDYDSLALIDRIKTDHL